jgi:hypothetical protein
MVPIEARTAQNAATRKKIDFTGKTPSMSRKSWCLLDISATGILGCAHEKWKRKLRLLLLSYDSDGTQPD